MTSRNMSVASRLLVVLPIAGGLLLSSHVNAQDTSTPGSNSPVRGDFLANESADLADQVPASLQHGCETYARELQANYSVSTSLVKTKKFEKNTAQTSDQDQTTETSDQTSAETRSEFTLTRRLRTVTHEYPGLGIADSWYQLDNGATRQTRFFDRQQRGIEFDPQSSAQAKAGWHKRYQLVDVGLRQSLDRVATHGEGCAEIQLLKGRTPDAELTLLWMPAWDLPVSFASHTTEQFTLTALQNVTLDAAKIQHEANVRARFKMTDYADIGDHEADPFLFSMIRLGFLQEGASGFYDVYGNPVGGGHRH